MKRERTTYDLEAESDTRAHIEEKSDTRMPTEDEEDEEAREHLEFKKAKRDAALKVQKISVRIQNLRNAVSVEDIITATSYNDAILEDDQDEERDECIKQRFHLLAEFGYIARKATPNLWRTYFEDLISLDHFYDNYEEEVMMYEDRE